VWPFNRKRARGYDFGLGGTRVSIEKARFVKDGGEGQIAETNRGCSEQFSSTLHFGVQHRVISRE
jgi:hypothetical protein